MADASSGRGGWVPGKKKKKKFVRRTKVSTGKREEVEIAQLVKRVEAEAPPVGSQEGTVVEFAELPISKYTQTGSCRPLRDAIPPTARQWHQTPQGCSKVASRG